MSGSPAYLLDCFQVIMTCLLLITLISMLERMIVNHNIWLVPQHFSKSTRFVAPISYTGDVNDD